MDKLSGYIEIEMGGKVRPIKFGMGAWKILRDTTGIELDQLGTIDPLVFSSGIIYAGLKQAALSSNEPIDFNEAKVVDMTETDGSDNVRVVMKFRAGTQVGFPTEAILAY